MTLMKQRGFLLRSLTEKGEQERNPLVIYWYLSMTQVDHLQGEFVLCYVEKMLFEKNIVIMIITLL